MLNRASLLCQFGDPLDDPLPMPEQPPPRDGRAAWPVTGRAATARCERVSSARTSGPRGAAIDRSSMNPRRRSPNSSRSDSKTN
ncbi:hypothetical protein WN51_07566 [Melipona quadrifasciata]|uniref:Uncharacterized protein n=1 Tax=Melipona quadrifasciata TaxID=166423 RepID=A0A0M9A7B1_9HYME|nr:hypothetical protein WN51_07566 [Melipona quadrifasciata]